MEMVLLDNSELVWMKLMQEYRMIWVSGAATYSLVSWIKTIKAHHVMLHIQHYHAKLLLSPLAPGNSSLHHIQTYKGTYRKSASKIRHLGKHSHGIDFFAYFLRLVSPPLKRMTFRLEGRKSHQGGSEVRH